MGGCRQGGAQEGKGEGSRLGGRSGRICLVCTGPGFHTQNTEEGNMGHEGDLGENEKRQQWGST